MQNSDISKVQSNLKNGNSNFFKKIPQINNQKKDMNDCLLINPSQVGNPIWKNIKNSYSIDEKLVADFVFPDSKISIIFLSLKYHYAYPLYIQQKIDSFSKASEYKEYPNKILICLFDENDINNYLNDIELLCFNYGIKVLLGFGYDEIAKYIISFGYIDKNKYVLNDIKVLNPKDNIKKNNEKK